MRKRKIAIITGSRAEYGYLYWIMKEILKDPALTLQLIVTGMHLSSGFGSTIKEIARDGFPIAARVRMLLPSDTEEAVAASMGLGVSGFAKVYSKLRPDIIVLLGDRFEIFAATSAAVPYKIPIAHIHGGESTEGVFDEQLRHAITKLSHIHFPSTEAYGKRIIQMGENPRRVFCFGSPAIDNIANMNFLDKGCLFRQLGIPEDKRIGIVTYHPVTLEHNTSERQVGEMLKALKEIDYLYWVFTGSNADTLGKTINERIRQFANAHPKRAVFHISLGRERYLSLLKNAAVMVGNSSSGLIEAPEFGLPVVNIGERQRGRTRGANVIDVKEANSSAMDRAIRKATSEEFKKRLAGAKNPYGVAGASRRIVKKLKTILLDGALIKKSFFEK